MKYYKHIKKLILAQVEDEVVMGENYVEITEEEYNSLTKKVEVGFGVFDEPTME